MLGLSCSTVCRTFPDQGSNLCLPHMQVDLLHEQPGKPPLAVLCVIAQLCPDSLRPHGLGSPWQPHSPTGSSVHGDSPGKNPGVGRHALLQGIFPTQGLNPDLQHCRRILSHLSHQGNSLIHVHYKLLIHTTN